MLRTLVCCRYGLDQQLRYCSAVALPKFRLCHFEPRLGFQHGVATSCHFCFRIRLQARKAQQQLIVVATIDVRYPLILDTNSLYTQMIKDLRR